MRNPPRSTLIAGPRVLLRKPTTRDCDEILQRMRHSRALHRGVVNPMATREEFATFLKRGRQSNRVQTVVCRRTDDVIVGVMNLNDIIRGLTQSAHVGYHAFRPYEGQGYMTEALDLILRYAFRTLKLHRIEAGIQPHNTRSITLVKRLGFRYEGTAKRLIKIAGRWRDHQRWAILAEEYRPSRARRCPRN